MSIEQGEFGAPSSLNNEKFTQLLFTFLGLDFPS